MQVQRAAVHAALGFGACVVIGACLRLVVHGALGGDACGWLPLVVADAWLLCTAQPQWQASSFWRRRDGLLSGQCATAAVCAFDAAPALLAVGLAIAPLREATLLSAGVTLLLLVLSAAAFLFWGDALRCLPRARLTDGTAALRRALFWGAHAALSAGGGGWMSLLRRCAALPPAALREELLDELRALRLPGHSLTDLAAHLIVAVRTSEHLAQRLARLRPRARAASCSSSRRRQVLALHVVIDAPVAGRSGRLWDEG